MKQLNELKEKNKETPFKYGKDSLKVIEEENERLQVQVDQLLYMSQYLQSREKDQVQKLQTAENKILLLQQKRERESLKEQKPISHDYIIKAKENMPLNLDSELEKVQLQQKIVTTQRQSSQPLLGNFQSNYHQIKMENKLLEKKMKRIQAILDFELEVPQPPPIEYCKICNIM